MITDVKNTNFDVEAVIYGLHRIFTLLFGDEFT